ncbi:MAG: winged helix-turn-helix domain-containing protein [Candidatus Saelkia tenebricola]|nr:winged helix-turn-helix domain-containing protein [Candidatus Saelkia tenebricola]
MITRVGIVAGEIWNYLEQNGQVPLSEIVSNVEQSEEIILMSLGWLAREGHVILEASNNSYLISLRK